MKRLVAVLLLGWTAVSIASTKHDDHPTPEAGTPEFWIGPAVSGTWYDPARSGEGVVLQMLPDGSVVAVWFTYPPEGEPGEQAWLLGVSADIDGSHLILDSVVQPQGARFGAAFDPGQVVQQPWGRFEIAFDDCNHFTLRYEGPEAYGSGERQLQRLTELDELQCNGERDLLPNGARAPRGLASKSGTWYVPDRSGEGWLIEEFPDGRSGVYWFTFDEAGRQRWIAGVGVREQNRLSLSEPFMTRGARFGEAFRSADVQFETFGTMALEYSGCGAMTLDYAAANAERGSAQRDTVRLTRIAGAPCLDQMPVTTGGLRWIERGTMPDGGTSEFAAVATNDHIYALGGFGSSRTVQRFTPDTGAWQRMPDLPNGRHHLAGFASGSSIYAIGGFQTGAPQDYVGAFRFDIASNVWEPRPEVLLSSASNTALLFGRAFIGSDAGVLQEYQPDVRRTRLLSASGAPAGRDHSQVVAFLDEIWMLGGRSPENAQVSIYDPVSTQWRSGPSMISARGGFAAATVGDRIIVSGGEFLSTDPWSVTAATEVYSAGSTNWVPGPNLPLPLHGIPGVNWRNRFFVLGGSQVAGIAANTNKVYELELP